MDKKAYIIQFSIGFILTLVSIVLMIFGVLPLLVRVIMGSLGTMMMVTSIFEIVDIN